MSKYKCVNEVLETAIELAMTIGQQSGAELTDIMKLRESLREMDNLLDKVKDYIYRLEDECNEVYLDTLIKELELNE